MMMGERARLTPVDVGWIGVGVFIFGLLIGPIYEALNGNAAALGTGDAYLFRMVIPGAILAVFVVVMATSIEGQ